MKRNIRKQQRDKSINHGLKLETFSVPLLTTAPVGQDKNVLFPAEKKDLKNNEVSIPIVEKRKAENIAAQLLNQSRRSKTIGTEGVWDDDDIEIKQRLASIATHQKRSDQLIRKRNSLSEWDQMLDAGKKKKLKTTKIELNPSINFFQQFTDQNFRS